MINYVYQVYRFFFSHELTFESNVLIVNYHVQECVHDIKKKQFYQIFKLITTFLWLWCIYIHFLRIVIICDTWESRKYPYMHEVIINCIRALEKFPTYILIFSCERQTMLHIVDSKSLAFTYVYHKNIIYLWLKTRESRHGTNPN
jgi:hypothetical protein